MAEEELSILDSVKKVLGLAPDYTAFDTDLIIHINSVFATLHQLGVGPAKGFAIVDNKSKWQEFIQNRPELNSVKSYVYVKVRLLFDPPGTSFLLDTYKELAAEFEWRLQVAAEKSEATTTTVEPKIIWSF